MAFLHGADILIPQGIDMKKWSVVACDQYTSEPQYWEEVTNFVGGEPSTLNLIFPEAYLEKLNTKEKIADINSVMNEYIQKGIFKEYKDALILVRRTINNGKVRLGLVGAVDLEDYEFTKGSKTPIRATEGTILSRIPPRVEIRCDAPLEFSHIMLLIDDPNRTVIEPLLNSELKKVYDFDLMQGGGHIDGRLIKDRTGIDKALAVLAKKELLFAVGDGNHSLATAKECWERTKPTLKEGEFHPARYALVEVVNIHDDALFFEPIHRVVFDCEPKKLLKALKEYYPNEGETEQIIKYSFKGEMGEIIIKNTPHKLVVGSLQAFLDSYGAKIDYIHGDDVTIELSKEEGNIGFLLPPMGKHELFEAVIENGELPRKTFSMGAANEKRFYLEGRKIRF